MNPELVRFWEEATVEYFKVLLGIYLERLRETMELVRIVGNPAGILCTKNVATGKRILLKIFLLKCIDKGEISDPYGDDYEDGCLLGCCSV
jgi:hypothetical protein